MVGRKWFRRHRSIVRTLLVVSLTVATTLVLITCAVSGNALVLERKAVSVTRKIYLEESKHPEHARTKDQLRRDLDRITSRYGDLQDFVVRSSHFSFPELNTVVLIDTRRRNLRLVEMCVYDRDLERPSGLYVLRTQ